MSKIIYRFINASFIIVGIVSITILLAIGSEATSQSPETNKPPEPVVPEKPITSTETAPNNNITPKSPDFEVQKAAKQMERFQEALKEKDETIRIWAVRGLAKYPSSISGPILLKQLREDNYLSVRLVIVYSLGEVNYKEAIPDLINILKGRLCDYILLKPPEFYQEKLNEIRRRIKDKRNEEIAETRSQMLESYNQKLQLGLLYIHTMQVLGKFKSKEATEEIYRLLFDTSVPIAYSAIDVLKMINDPKAIELLSKGKLSYWDPPYRERLTFALTELNTPYNQPRPCKGTEWILKSIFMLSKAEVERPGQSDACLRKVLNIMRLLTDSSCTPYKFSGEDNLMMEFISLANLLKGNNPEIMLYDYDLLIQFIKDEMQTRALYQTFQDVLKPQPQIAVPTGGSDK